MTLTVAWLRAIGDVRELVLASDSRLRAGYAWDAAPKILPLPRNDSAIAFAGDTDVAYPLMLQALHTVHSYDRALNRNLSLDEFNGHMIRIFNLMLQQVGDLPTAGLSLGPEAIFLFCGFDWRAQRFRIWSIEHDPAEPAFGANSIHIPDLRRRANRFRFIGDGAEAAKLALVDYLREIKRWPLAGLDMEPLQILGNMINSPEYPSIGGFPQVVKIYRSLNVVPFAVTFNGQRSFLGRPLLDYEKPDLVPDLVVDVDG